MFTPCSHLPAIDEPKLQFPKNTYPEEGAAGLFWKKTSCLFFPITPWDGLPPEHPERAFWVLLPFPFWKRRSFPFGDQAFLPAKSFMVLLCNCSCLHWSGWKEEDPLQVGCWLMERLVPPPALLSPCLEASILRQPLHLFWRIPGAQLDSSPLLIRPGVWVWLGEFPLSLPSFLSFSAFLEGAKLGWSSSKPCLLGKQESRAASPFWKLLHACLLVCREATPCRSRSKPLWVGALRGFPPCKLGYGWIWTPRGRLRSGRVQWHYQEQIW